MSSSALLKKSDAVIEWFWTHGTLREDPRFAVPRGTWLDAVYRCRDQARTIQRGETSAKPCMALWGPSQTGKSTLMSGYLDDPEDALGERSALRWSETEPVRFVVGKNKSDEVIVLNPFNFGSDASGCVSRYVLCDAVPDPEHPVEVTLATETQILHALAVGYLSECEERNAKGEITAWDAASFTALLDRQQPTGTQSRAAFEALQQLAETVDLLILSEIRRYSNLSSQWAGALRPQMLECEGLLGSVTAVDAFAAELLWDAWSSLTKTYQALVTKRRQCVQQWGGGVVRCSFRTASILLDIDSYKKCEERPETRAKVMALTAKLRHGVGCISSGPGTPLARDGEDFGQFQALVWELRIPLRRDVLRERAPVLYDFLEVADLLDFPGVANNYGNATKHKDGDLAGKPVVMLTEVLKRGKTASIVVTGARSLDIDGFSLLMRLGKFPAQPVQLVAGISSWLRAFGHAWPPHGKAMPLNLIMTFCADLVNKVMSAGLRDGLQGCFDQLKSLGHLADPKVVNALATNYPQFNECHIFGTPEEQSTALEGIVADAAFHERFGDSAQSFREMVANGGTNHVFRTLREQASTSKRAELLQKRLAETAKQLQQLVLQHLPSESAVSDDRDGALDAWAAAIQQRLHQPRQQPSHLYTSVIVSRHLREFLNIDPDEIDDVPLHAARLKLDFKQHVERQFRSWQARRALYPQLAEVGVQDGTQASRLLSYLIEVVDLESIVGFFRDNLGNITSRVEGRQARRFLAIQMSNAMLCSSVSVQPHRAPKAVNEVLEELAQSDEQHNAAPEQSTHYRAVIAPFLQRLEQVKSMSTGARPPQAGDAELAAIAGS
ncbi:MAG: virulence factor SrfC family protein [Roseimicrobium sp.]